MTQCLLYKLQIVPRRPLYLGRNLRKVHKILRKNVLNQKSQKSRTIVSSVSDTILKPPGNIIEEDSSQQKQETSTSNSTFFKACTISPTRNETCTSIVDNEVWKNRFPEGTSGIDDNYIVFDNEELKINFSNYKRVFLLHKHISLYKKNSFRQAKRVSISCLQRLF